MEAVDLAAVDDQTVAGQQGVKGASSGLIRISACWWSSHSPTSGNHALYTASLALNSNRSQFGLSDSGRVAARRACSAGVATRSNTPSGSGASGSASIPIAETRGRRADCGGGVAGAMSHTALHPSRPDGCTAHPGQDRHLRITQPAQAGPGTTPHRGIFTPPCRYGVGDDLLLLREQHPTRSARRSTPGFPRQPARSARA